jgi:hypothetical protein
MQSDPGGHLLVDPEGHRDGETSSAYW